ncbi:MAG: alpha-amylase family glycosyl hydrolase [Spirochaetales bacterium]
MSRTTPAWLEKAVFYEIYPQSFYDSNGDGIGDLPGVIEKLDYVRELGCTGIWLNPFFVSPFRDAGYDVADYCAVDPRYGTNDDAKRLFDEAHARGIRVLIDLVPGHTSIDHPWFQAAASAEATPYDDYYVWTESVWQKPPEGYKWLTGYGDRDGSALLNFFWAQPALNYGFGVPDPNEPWQQPIDAPGPKAVREEMRRVMAFWLEMGCDGFRVDMAESLIKGPNKHAAGIKLWQELRSWLEELHPEAVLQAEWGKPSDAIEAGFHMDFLLHFGDAAYTALFRKDNGFSHYLDPEGASYFARSGRGNLMSFLSRYLTFAEATRGRGFINIPSGNHDIAPRLALGRSIEDLRIVFAFLLTMPGVPFIYYGDEIGMNGYPGLPSKEGGYIRTQVRTPMRWTDGPKAGFSSAAPDEFYLPVDPEPADANVGVQAERPDSLLSFVKQLIRLRTENDAFAASSELTPLYFNADSPLFAYELTNKGKRALVVLNPSNRGVRGTIDLSDVFAPIPEPVHSQGTISIDEGGNIELGPVSFAIFVEVQA